MSSGPADPTGEAHTTVAGAPSRHWPYRAVRLVMAVAIGMIAMFALAGPTELDELTPGSFLRLPLEAVILVAALAVLPARSGRILGMVAGVLLGVLAILKTLDLGFGEVMSRPFHPVFDWAFLGPSVDLLAGELGHTGAILVTGGIGVAVVVLVFLLARGLMRLAGAVAERRPAALRAAAVLGACWLLLAAFGQPVATSSAAEQVADRADQIWTDLHDQAEFTDQLAAADPFHDVPADRLLTALRGKDVILAVVESYGRAAVELPDVAPQIRRLLAAETQRLSDAGYAARSAFLTSPTTGGASWLAHSTLQSGLWIDNPGRYGTLVDSDRFTLSKAFRRAGWRTASVVPAHTRDWPEGRFYGFHRYYDARNLGYRGPAFSYATMPDQYTLDAFHRLEHGRPDRRPLMAELDLVSSHWPWAPLPELVSWPEVGDGSVYDPMPAAGASPDAVWEDLARVRAAYADSIEYSLRALISYIRTFGDDDLVVIVVGDHQPSSAIAGKHASRDVPISIVTRDDAVLGRIGQWGWHEGLRPGSRAPVWPMDAFRDRFLTAFGPDAAAGTR